MTLRSSLGRVKGLGSAKEGVHHWRHQRLTAIALVPLALWFAISLLCKFNADHAAVVAWIAAPHVTVLLLALSLGLFWHLKLGLQVIIEDYVHDEWTKTISILAANFACIFVAVACIFAILNIAIGG